MLRRSRKGADETTWSCDGQRGYVYGFFTDDIALFRFRGTRRKFVAEDVFGSLRLRCGDPVARLTEALDAYALDRTFKIEDSLFPLPKA